MGRLAILLQGLISNLESVTTEEHSWVTVKCIINRETGDAMTNWRAYAPFTGTHRA